MNVTHENFEAARADCSALDQQAELIDRGIVRQVEPTTPKELMRFERATWEARP